MPRTSEFYKGRRKKRNYALIPGVALLLLGSILIVLFYSAQKYAVISDDGVSIELPLLTSGAAVFDETGKEAAVFEQADVTVQFDQPDYSGVPATAGAKVKPVRAIYVPYDDVSPEKISEYANRLSSGNALLLNLKEKNGYLAWYSSAPLAASYGLNMNTVESKEELQTVLSMLKEDNIYVIGQISCCMDELLGAHSTEVNLRNAYSTYFYDENGYWLDPYSTIVRNYTVQLVKELWDMGFDEVVLSNVVHPVAEPLENPDGSFTQQVYYTREMSTEPSPVGAVSGFIVNVAEQLSDREEGKFLSAYLGSSTALGGVDTSNGQDGPLFFKVFDRVYYETDKYAYTFDVEKVKEICKVGSYKNRFVPVVINYLPDNTSWILVDKSS